MFVVIAKEFGIYCHISIFHTPFVRLSHITCFVEISIPKLLLSGVQELVMLKPAGSKNLKPQLGGGAHL